MAVGVAITIVTGSSALRSGSRQVILGMLAAAITFGLGSLVGDRDARLIPHRSSSRGPRTRSCHCDGVWNLNDPGWWRASRARGSEADAEECVDRDEIPFGRRGPACRQGVDSGEGSRRVEVVHECGAHPLDDAAGPR
jgi:hypothetical protein